MRTAAFAVGEVRHGQIELARALVFLGAFADACPEMPQSFSALAGQVSAGSKWRVLQEAALGALTRPESLPALRLAGARLAENQNGTVGAGDATDERAQ